MLDYILQLKLEFDKYFVIWIKSFFFICAMYK